MRRTRRALAGAVLAVGIGLTGCGTPDAANTLDPDEVTEESPGGTGDPDPVDGGEDDADGVDPGTGGIDDDEDTATNEDGGDEAGDSDEG